MTSEVFAYDPSVLERPMLMANGLSSGTLEAASAYIHYYKSSRYHTRFDIQGVDNGTEFKTTYGDGGYRTAISIGGGAKVEVPYQSDAASVGSSLTAQTELDIVNGGRYVKITYSVTNSGSTTQSFQIGSSADVMIHNNDRAEVEGVFSGNRCTGLSMDGSPKNSYQFSLVAPDCDTLWYGFYSVAYNNLFNDLGNKHTPYSGDSGMAWSWSGTVAPGQTWSRYVLIGAGELPAAPSAPVLESEQFTLYAGRTATITGTATASGDQPAPDTVYVSIGGKEYSADVENGSFSMEVEVPEDMTAGSSSFTYWGTTDEGGISEVKTQTVTMVTAPLISLTTGSATVMEGDTVDLNSYIRDKNGDVTISPSGIDTSKLETTTVTYTASIDGYDSVEAELTVTVLPHPTELTETTVTGSGTDFSLSATMTYTGSLTYVETGFVYGALQNPTLTLNDGTVKTTDAVNTKGGTLSAALSKDELVYGVTYYARAYAKTADGTVFYGGQSQGFGVGNPSYGTFSVTNSGSGTFTITRSGGTDGEQTVYYRTVNGSAVGGTHFEHKYGTLTFADGSSASQTVTVTEHGVTSTYGGSAATAYSNADRTYSLEIYRVTGGAGIGTGTAERTMTKDNAYTVDAKLFNEYQKSASSGETDRGDYDGTGRGWKENTEGNNAKEIVTIDTILPTSSYLTAVAQNIQYKLSFQAKEVDDGYQHIQISPGEGIDLSQYPYEGTWKGTMDSAVYAAIFRHGGDGTSGTYVSYTFPNINSSVPNLHNEVWREENIYKGDGYIKLPVDTAKLTVGFAGSGSGNDAWKTNAVTHYLKYLDTQEPQLLGVAPMAGGSYLPGDSVTVALVFDEIVDSANSSLNNVSIETTWGTFNYAGGADTNVLYFTGTVTGSASNALTVNSITNGGNIKDMANDTGTDTSGTVSDGSTSAALGNDSDAPTVTVGPLTNDNGTLTGSITAANAGKLEYAWSTQAEGKDVVGWKLLADKSGGTVSTRQTSGTWYLHARATNNDGVTAYASNSYTFTGSDPVQLPGLTVSANNADWAKTRDITVTRTPDNATVTVKTPDGKTETVPGSTYTAHRNGVYIFTLTSGSDTVTQTVTVSKLDTTAPTVTFDSLSNTHPYTEPITLTVRVSDGESGIGTVTGTWSSGNNSRDATFTGGANGVYTTESPDESGDWVLTVTATDGVGNTGTDTSLAYTVNATRPGLTVTKQSESATGVVYSYTVTANNNTGITVTLPDGSTTTALTGTFTITEPGDYLIAVTDAAGHFVSEPINVTAPGGTTLDGVAPDVRLSIASEEWTNQAITVTVSVYDAGSTGKTLTASRDGQTISLTETAGEPGAFTGSFTVSANSTYTVTCTDAAGNGGSGQIEITNIDTTAPEILASGNPTDWTAGNITITLTVTDGQSGVSSVAVEKDGVAVPFSGDSGSYTFTASENGDYIVTAADTAGNSASETVTVSRIDKSTPSISVTGGMQSAASLDLTVSADTPGGSGVTVTVTKDGQNADTVQNGSYAVTAAGTYLFTATTGAGLTAQQTVTVYGVTMGEEEALVVSGGKVTRPAAPTKDGYTFGGWYHGSAPWNFETDTVTGTLTLTAEWTLKAPTVTLRADKTSVTYGETITLTAQAEHDAGDDVDYSYAWYKGTEVLTAETGETLKLTEVGESGSYTVRVTASDGTLTSDPVTSDPVSVTIQGATPDYTLPTGLTARYGDALSSVTLPEGWTWKDTSALVGGAGQQSHTAIFTPADTANYEPVEQLVTVTVNKAILTPSVTSVEDKEYDGSTETTGTISLTGGVLGENPTATGVFTLASADAGQDQTVHVAVTLDGDWDENYELSTEQLTGTAHITPKTVGLTWSGYENLVYTGQPVHVTAEAAGLLDGDTCAVLVEGGSEVDVGTYTATATGLDNPNYRLPADGATREYTIAQGAGTASVTMAGWTYGGTASAPAPASATHGVDHVTYRYTGTTAGGRAYDSSAVPTEAGSYTVTATFAANDNYEEVTATAAFTVARKTLSAAWLGLDQVYGDGTTVRATLSGVVSGDDVTASIAGAKQTAGSHALTASLTGNDASNYTLKNSTATLTIQPKPVIFTVSGNTVQADGEKKTATVAADDQACPYTVTYRQSGSAVSAPTEPGSYEIWVQLTDPNYRHTNGSAAMQVGTLTITQAPPVVYTATFTGGESALGAPPDAQTAVAGGQITLPANPFTRENHLFRGWKTDGGNTLYQPGETYAMPAGDVTFTAQWQAVFEVTGTVTEKTDGTDTPAVVNAVVSLWLGANKLSEVTTGSDGTFEFKNLVPGIYNLVVTKDERTVTSKVEITTENKSCNAVLPKGATNSIVEVTPGSPDIVVGGLDKVFEKTDEEVYTTADEATVTTGGKVEITFTAEEKQQEDQTITADMKKIAAEKNSSVTLGLVMDYTLEKEVYKQDGQKDEEASKKLTQVNVLLEILLPLPAGLQGKESYSVYRVHSGTAQTLPQGEQNKNADEEYFTVSSDKTGLTLYVKCFSTYAIGYTESSENSNNNNNQTSSGGGSSSPTYAPTVVQPEHGSVTVSPKLPHRGDQVTITPTPEEGYTVDQVLVTGPDGKPVAVTPNDDGTYAFLQPAGTVTITVTFRQIDDPSHCLRDEHCPIAPFVDADRSAWYHDGVHYCLNTGLMAGTGETTFAPNIPITRGMIVTILWRLEGCPVVDAPMDYDDVTPEDWYGAAVGWAADAGVTAGYDNGKFGPNDPITREQMAVMLWRYAGSPAAEGALSAFVDEAQTSSWARTAMIWAVDRGLIAGVGNDRLAPLGQATRAQAATILMRFAQDMAQSLFSSISNHNRRDSWE